MAISSFNKPKIETMKKRCPTKPKYWAFKIQKGSFLFCERLLAYISRSFKTIKICATNKRIMATTTKISVVNTPIIKRKAPSVFA